MFDAEFHSSISEISPETWNGLFDSDNPFLRHSFLEALEESGCADSGNGWTPRHLVLHEGGQAVAALPLYIKSHSYGEFVFDWGWAEAFAQSGLDYYPKLTSAVPFTPSSGPRLGVLRGLNRKPVIKAVCNAVMTMAKQHGLSGWHLLFPEIKEKDRSAYRQAGLLERRDVQFHWFNRSYKHFDDYLAALKSSRRKNLRRERKAVAAQGIVLERIPGPKISQACWAAFYRCYCHTYLKRSGHPGYLNQAFFDRLLERQPETLMLVVARTGQEIVATSLFFHDSQRLYGRYWGALREIDFLHFEACFYQGVEYCIERGIGEFDPGTQGEHKLLRGFEPVPTQSWHWVADARFRQAIARFLEAEKSAVSDYENRAARFLPFRIGAA